MKTTQGGEFRPTRQAARYVITLIVLAATAFVAVQLADSILGRYKFYRDLRVQQTREVTDGIKMRIEGSYLTVHPGTRVFHVCSRWIGGDLSEFHAVRASIRTTEQFEAGRQEGYWYVPLGVDFQTTDGPAFLWAFYAPPGSPEKLWMRVFFRPKDSQEAERWVDFEFPYFQSQDQSPPMPMRKRISDFLRSSFQAR